MSLKALLGLAIIAGLTAFLIWKVGSEGVKPAQLAESERRGADRLYASGDYESAKREYRGFIDRHSGSTNKEVQDVVGHARIRLAYAEAKTKDFAAAREVLKEAEREYRGTGIMGSDYGGVPDQAAYQVAVSLVAEGKKAEAKDEFIAFIKKHQQSPLVNAAWKRLVQLNDGKSTDEYDTLLQGAVSEQQKTTLLELASCGPKVIAHLLEREQGRKVSHSEIAKIAGTKTDGTTMQGMVMALGHYGFRATGMLLNREDFVATRCPAIWLMGSHFVLVQRIEPLRAQVYDPMEDSERWVDLSHSDATDYRAVVLVLNREELK